MNKKTLGFIGTLLLILIGLGVYTYLQMMPDPNPNKSTYIYDFKSKKAYVQSPIDSKIINGDNIKMFWLKVVDSDGSYTQNRMEMNCNMKMYRGVQYASFSKDKETIDSSPYVETDWEVVVPETNYNLVMNYVCSSKHN